MTSLRARLRIKRSVLAGVGVHDAFSALLAERAGFDLLFAGGFGLSASLLGQLDLNLLTLTESADAVRRIASRVSLPVVADGDTGHGSVHNVFRTVQEFESAGAAGILLEDQTWPKRCGHLAGKSVVPAREMLERLSAAMAARKNRDFLIFARTDARAIEGLGAAIRRAHAYERAGADVIFVEAPQSEGELARIGRSFRAPLMANMLRGGRTPIVSRAHLKRLGFSLAAYPLDALCAAGAGMAARMAEIVADRPAPEVSAMSFPEVVSLLDAGFDSSTRPGRARLKKR